MADFKLQYFSLPSGSSIIIIPPELHMDVGTTNFLSRLNQEVAMVVRIDSGQVSFGSFHTYEDFSPLCIFNEDSSCDPSTHMLLKMQTHWLH